MLKNLLSLIFITILSTNILNAQTITKIAPKREFRGVWVATVANIDWPSKPGLTTDEQKQELIGILERHKSQGMNAIILQIRPAADAFYEKSREPWSQWLMGKQGVAPSPGYDPLAFAIKEAHFRGMELHAWFNPYRASMGSIANVSADHATKKHPDWFFVYGGKYQFDPGIPEVREYIVQVILDVVKGYDIDGVHFDDYFYPYAIAGQTIKDAETFYKHPNNISDIKEWRRNNVNLLIKQLDDSIHHYKKYVKFGISPFGIWRNKYEDPEGSESNGLSNYGELYADSRKWVKEGWVDYINPQVYFTFSRKVAPFATLVNWWSNNTYGRHLYIGQAGYLVNSRSEQAWKNPSEIPNQIRFIRANNRIQGSVFFSSKSMSTVAKAVGDSLKNDFYKYPALPPQMPWLDDTPPNQPQQFTAEAHNDGVHLKWANPFRAKDGETASGYVIYRFEEGEKISILDPKNILKISFEDYLSFIDTTVEPGKRYSYLLTALDRLKNESDPTGPVGVEIPKLKKD
ncbi:glycoside hydrolase [Pedobacter changchengzhani]|uniref:Glycoside hydrolase n=1 Tax=Pedobacter changchengzhani TaxID=2529274 RepID=A0A4R5MPR9_9SPHI|nr:family 10 glycosylhydrolase [Pedobacter changchengzhani]TDG37355.1 glycoside hydrolase [Pedobacter changchengzhani]